MIRNDVRNVSQRDQFGFVDEGAQVSLHHKAEALFFLLVHLMQHVVDERKQFGRASFRGTSKPVERFRVVKQGLWIFHVQNAQVAYSAQFKANLV